MLIEDYRIFIKNAPDKSQYVNLIRSFPGQSLKLVKGQCEYILKYEGEQIPMCVVLDFYRDFMLDTNSKHVHLEHFIAGLIRALL